MNIGIWAGGGMALSTSGIAEIIFRQSVKSTDSLLDFDGRMLRILMAFDGSKTLGEISEQLGMNLESVRQIVVKLVKFKLVERVEPELELVDHEFMVYLVSQLSLAIGPLSAIIVEDSIEKLGFTAVTLPVSRTADLVGMVSEEIYREVKRTQFQHAMQLKMRSMV